MTWNTLLVLRTFNFNTNGGEYVVPFTGYVLNYLPTTTKTGSEFVQWNYDSIEATLPIIPEVTDPSTITLDAQWTPWTYNIRYYKYDDAGTRTLYNSDYSVEYDEAFGTGRLPASPGNSATLGIFRGWKNSEETVVNKDYKETRDLSSGSWNLDVDAYYLSTAGLVFTYDVSNDVYDVTTWSMPTGNVGSYDILVPAEFDDGTNGNAEVRHVSMYDSTRADRLGTLEIEENSLTNRIFKDNTASGTYYTQDHATSVVIPDGFVKIGNYAFSKWNMLSSITLPDSIVEFGYSSFDYTYVLTSISFPASLTTIGSGCFRYGALENITIPESVTSIGTSCFGNNDNLKTIVTNSVVHLGLSSLKDCYNLESITFNKEFGLNDILKYQSYSSKVKYIFNVAPDSSQITLFAPVTGESNTYRGIIKKSINTVELFCPQSDDEISLMPTGYILADSLFNGNTNLVDVDVSNYALERYIFEGASNLETCILPSSMTVIPHSIFRYCTSLTSITIPSTVTEIDDYAFSETGLTSVTLPSGLLTIGSFAFG